jgi:cell wall-associated NlpC family hydrolase
MRWRFNISMKRMGVRLFLTLLIAAVTLPAAAQQKVVLGKLGQSIQETKIYAQPGRNARVYYTVKPYEYLVIKSSKNQNYFLVLLQNGQYGYVPTEHVASLPYDVTSDRPTVAAGNARGTAALNSRTRAAVAQYSLNYTGTPYKWGGNDPLNGIDCSAFVKYLYGQIGVNLPRTAAEQVRVGKPVTRLEDLQPGDRLYFWSAKRNMIGHTGIYLGNGYFCHSSTNHGKVATDHLSKGNWLKTLVAARR